MPETRSNGENKTWFLGDGGLFPPPCLNSNSLSLQWEKNAILLLCICLFVFGKNT